MKRIVLTIIISCMLIAVLLLAFMEFIVNRPQQNNTENSVHSQATSTSSTQTTGIPNVSTAPLDTSAPPTSESQAPVIPDTSPNEPESKPQDIIPQTSLPAHQDELPAWKRQYANYAIVIQNYHNYDHFALIYLDDDDIPELYMYGNGKAKLCTVDGNHMYGIDLAGYGGGNYCEKSGNFMNITQEENYLVMRIYRMENNAFSETFCGMEDKTTDPPTYYIGDPEVHVAVTEQTMKATVAQYIDTSDVKFLHENALGYDDFIEMLSN